RTLLRLRVVTPGPGVDRAVLIDQPHRPVRLGCPTETGLGDADITDGLALSRRLTERLLIEGTHCAISRRRNGGLIRHHRQRQRHDTSGHSSNTRASAGGGSGPDQRVGHHVRLLRKRCRRHYQHEPPFHVESSRSCYRIVTFSVDQAIPGLWPGSMPAGRDQIETWNAFPCRRSSVTLPDMEQRATSYHSQGLNRALAILRLLGKADTPLTLAAI